MNFRTIILTVAASLLAACSTSATLYPMSGAFFEAGDKAPIKAKVDGLERNGGKMTLTLPSGENMEGRWSIVDNAQNVASWGNLMVQYDPNVSQLSSNPNAYRVTAYLVGSEGTTMDVEYIVNAITSRGQGIARDSDDNVYRLVF